MPASYPTTVKTFNTKVNLTDIVDASHPNSVQEEVVAIETILGISPNVSTTPNPATGFAATSAAYASLAARLANIENGIVGDSHNQYLKVGVFTAKGQVASSTGIGSVGAVAVGTNGFLLTADSTTATGVKWAAPSTDLILKSMLTTKGDLVVTTAAATPVRLGVGTNGQVLVADSAQAAGVRWGAAAATDAVSAALVDAKGDLIVGSANDAVARLPVGANGLSLVADSAAASGVKWAAKTTRIGHTFTISGEVRLAAGDDYYIPPFFLNLPSGQTAVIATVRAVVRSGTSVAFQFFKNDVAFGSNHTATTTATTDGQMAGQVLANDDGLRLVANIVTGTPKNLSVTVFIDYSV